MRRDLLLVLAFVVLLRLPFLDQALQLDDYYYLAAAQYAQQEPLHPHHVSYVFLGDKVDMRGHPHPPFVAWFLGLLIWVFGGVKPVAFHAVFVGFSLVAAAASLSIARRFSPHPVIAAVLAMLAPAFVVDGPSFMSDLPFLAWWTAAIALFLGAVERRSGWRLAVSAVCLTLASLTAYQAVFAIPILFVYEWKQERRWGAALAVSLVPALAAGGFQVFERLSSGALPASVLVGYFKTYQLQTASIKLRNALALTAHLGWLLFPALAAAAFWRRRWWVLLIAAAAAFADPHPLFWVSFGVGALVLVECARKVRTDWLALWICAFFACALVVFFAGAARYLLPVSLPVAILATRALEGRRKWLIAGVAAQAVFTLALAWVSFEHWEGYRRFARDFAVPLKAGRLWVNGEWSIRYYLDPLGGQPVVKRRPLTGEGHVVTSALSYPIPVTAGGTAIAPVTTYEIRPALPLRLMGLGAKSAYATVSFGVRPFDVSMEPVDVIRLERLRAVEPQFSWLPMNGAAEQMVSGIYGLERNSWRWMGGEAVFLLKPPEEPARVAAEFVIPEMSPARRVRLLVDGAVAAERRYAGPGNYVLESGARFAGRRITVEVDRTFQVPGDNRVLGIILTGVGFRVAR
jgi:4-amino-4-deoxy-L-arabinose transferase-like glycosyltransferase